MTAPRLWRIRDAATFTALHQRGRRARHGSVNVTWLAGDDDRIFVAFAVRRQDAPAVVRNRIRRRLRTVVRELAPRLPAGSYLLRAGSEVARQDFEQLREDVAAAVSNLTSESGR